MDINTATEIAYKNGYAAALKEKNKKDEIITELLSIFENLAFSGVLSKEEYDSYDRLLGEYERICVKETR